MKETDIIICLKKRNKNLKNIKKGILSLKNQRQFFLDFFSFHCINMIQKSLSFGENHIIKNAFHQDKIPINIYEVDVQRIVLPDKKSHGNKDSFEYFIGFVYKGNVFPAPLCIKLPQMSLYSKYFGKNNKCMTLLVNDQEILGKFNKVWKKI